MKIAEMERDEAIDWLLEQAAIHYDGDDQNAHLIATELNAGFASPQTVMQASGMCLKDNELGVRYPNILDVPCGLYATTNQWYKNGQLKQIGDGSIMKLSVIAEHNDRKLLIASDGYSGGLYILRTHTGNNYNSPGWRKINTTFTLFEGSKSGVGTTIDLADNMKHYDTVRIHIAGWGGQIYEASNVTSPVISFCNTYDSSAGMEMYELKLERVTDKQYRIVRSSQQYITGTSTGAQYKPNIQITIAKIEGVK